MEQTLLSYVEHTLCNRCKELLARDPSEEWEEDRATGLCTSCRNHKIFRKKRESWPEPPFVQEMQKLEMDHSYSY